MVVNNPDLSIEELDFLINKFSREGDEPEVLDIELKDLTQTELQADLKARLQRSIDDLRANNEEVSPDLLQLLERL